MRCRGDRAARGGGTGGGGGDREPPARGNAQRGGRRGRGANPCRASATCRRRLHAGRGGPAGRHLRARRVGANAWLQGCLRRPRDGAVHGRPPRDPGYIPGAGRAQPEQPQDVLLLPRRHQVADRDGGCVQVLRMPPEVRGMHEPYCRWQDLGRVFSLEKDAGILRTEGVVDMANAADASGRYSHEDKVFPGIFVVVTSDHAGVRSSMGSLFEPGFGGTAQQWGPNWGLFRPYHLACVEVPMSVARAVVQGRPTGDLQGGMVAELIAVAKRDLKPGDELDGAGGYTVYGLSERYEVAREQRLLPFGFAYGGRVKRPVARDQALSWDDVEVERSGFLYELREEQDRLFG